jgi:hypothetical protein
MEVNGEQGTEEKGRLMPRCKVRTRKRKRRRTRSFGFVGNWII